MTTSILTPKDLVNPVSSPHAVRADQVWNDSLAIIRGRVNNQNFKTWFEPIIPLRVDGNRFIIQVPSQFFFDWLEEHYYALLNEVLTQVTKQETLVDYEVCIEDRDTLAMRELELSMRGQSVTEAQPPDVSERPEPPGSGGHPPGFYESSLNPRYTFDNFVKGESNQFARAGALAVSNNPGGRSFNPLFIYGGVGLGKTHLVHAIGNAIIRSGKTKRVLYISSERFTVDFVDAIQKDSVSQFSNFYRSVDVLIIDDVQFLAGKEKTQDIFFHTFNALYHLGKQIVLSSDKPPKDLRGLHERLISRFQCGLTADIEPPDLETRIAILRKKSGDDGIDLPHDILEFIASNVSTNIRELEGCLISLLARASLENRQIDINLAREVVRTIMGDVRTHITVDEIQRVVCDHFHIAEDLIRAKTRKQEIVNARQIAMYLTKELSNSSLKTIGLHFGGRDHSTVIHAYQTVVDGMKNDENQRSLVQLLRSKIEMGMR